MISYILAVFTSKDPSRTRVNQNKPRASARGHSAPMSCGDHLFVALQQIYTECLNLLKHYGT